MNIAKITAAFGILVVGSSTASQLTYLSCDLPARKDVPATHFDFTLDEENSTVSFFVKAAKTANKEKAVFGPDKIEWANDFGIAGGITRTISRTNMSFVQYSNIAGIESREVGKCSIVNPPARKF